MLKPGKVEEIEGEKAWVRMQKGTSCGEHHCPLSSTLLNDSGTDFYKVLAKNEISASIGSSVMVEVKDALALKISFLIYLMPILLVLGTYLIAKALTSQVMLIGAVTIIAIFISIIILKKADKLIQPEYSITGYLRDDDCSQCPFKSKRTKEEEKDTQGQ
ncbi:SoxR reducing system RseC family protein [Atribacter laminatus]|jgi:positive regulator of sigma E activity|uniref:Positive regulator of sigma(E), RseC/MucC n=1 Tax=Atribacter laminatus TaxID=2847778 RepID=A0A7T1AKS9_ATRLM|nr:SoxR reducing system RseC family protein [Atribacter laminatus]QPM67762.1 hypothetical protein RT761_00974 [Atribacter laminatus]